MNYQKIIFLNKVLFAIVIALIIYLGISVILMFNPEKEYRLKIPKRNYEIPAIDKKPSQTQQPLSFYQKLSSGRPFTSLISTPSPLPKVKEILNEEPIPLEVEVTFQLIGIIWGEEGANALIKSSQERQSQLVTIGDKISEYQVIAITKEAVILSKGNERKVVGLEYPK